MEFECYQELIEKDTTHWWFLGKKKFLDVILDRYTDNGNEKCALDIGCGTGGIIEQLGARGFKSFGIDNHEIAFNFCQKKNLPVFKADAKQTGFEASSFDVVCALDVIEHDEDDLAIIREVKRILKPGGIFIVMVPAHQWLWSHCDKMNHHKRRYSKKSLLNLLNREFRTLHISWIHCSIFIPASVIITLRKILQKDQVRYTNPTHYTNLLMNYIYELEKNTYRTFHYLPFGTSIAAAAVKAVRIP
ncbi:MAG: methyltransferase domain-containing protein [Deltaproteobacteria bacterium]|nr:methyltransferase domain-containing protein [Deltaproteobacteria bacterium]